MNRSLLSFALVPLLLAGCGTTGSSLAGALTTNSLGADNLGGLTSTVAAHASVEAAQPSAFVLVTQGASFLAALQETVEPQRVAIAAQITSNATVMSELKNWTGESTATQLAALKEVEALECQTLGCNAPPLVENAGTPPEAGMMALYQPGTSDIGQITIYSSTFASDSPYLALATVVHETRHAAQYQMVLSYEAGGTGMTADERTLASSYDQAWAAMDAWGGEAALSYGDYVHLAVEYDAFQTGNEVAAIVSGGTYTADGSGFVDTRYKTAGTPLLSVAPLVSADSESALVGAVNQAEAVAERVTAPSNQGGGTVPVIEQRHQGITRSFGGGNSGGGGRGFGF